MSTFSNGCNALLLAVLVSFAASEASGQGMPRRDRGGSPRDTQQSRDRAAPATSVDPFSAMERELPSLKVDLMLTPEQVSSWVLFERDVRDIAEMDRARKRHLLALRDEGQRPPTAVTLVATLAEEERQKSEATLDLKRHLDSLYAMLDDRQKQMLDRRVVQSQAQPLGQ
jgi:LTXXQ motif family protein